MFDVVIIGGGTAGCSCAWNCAKAGLNTALIEKEAYLGGTMTGALVVPVMKSGNNQINTDFYSELIFKMKNSGNQITYQSNPGWFNPVALKDTLKEMLVNNGVKLFLNSDIKNIKLSDHTVRGIEFSTDALSVYNYSIYADNIHLNNADILSVYIETKYVVDSTGDLNFCEKINCNFLENNLEFPPMSLRFIMSGIDLEAFSGQLLEIDTDRNVTTVEHINGSVHLSTAYTWDSNTKWALAPLFEDAVNKGILKDSDRNYFQVFTVAGMPDSLAFNCPRIIEKLNPLSSEDIEKAYNIGKSAINRIADFCKLYFKGFENSYISHIADKVGIRASRQIKGRYLYTIDDLRSGKKFTNPAVISNYPVDIHSRNKDASVLEKNNEYQLPVESLMSYDYDNLYVAGRGLSADKLSQGALRVQASCFSMGEAVAKDIYSKINSPVLF